jgi:GDSL-like Lipase/Acylhydrolase family
VSPPRLGLLAALVALAFPRAANAQAPRYLALGDSLAEGIQTRPDGHHFGTNRGYADFVWRSERSRFTGLRLVKLGRGGATASDMLHARGRQGVTQIDQAVQQIRGHRVMLVTIDIGAWEVERCLSGIRWPSACTGRALAAVRRELPAIVQRLRDAAGGRALPIVGVDYYNFFLARWRLGSKGRTVADPSVAVEHTINRVLSAAYRRVGVPTADVEGAFDSLQMHLFVRRRPWGRVPLAVARVCDWTFACSVRGDDHANSRGYRVMGEATLRALARYEPRAVDPTTGGVG